MERVRSIGELASYFKAQQIGYQQHQGQVWLPVQREGFETTAMILWPDDLTLVQVILPLPFSVPAGAASAMSEAMTRLNHASIVPGFGLDHEHQQPYFRLVQPRQSDGSFLVTDLQRMLSAALRSAAQFSPQLAKVVSGELAAADIAE